ncbi:sorting nexin-6 isoform X1 [Neodiprion pinetum]|uniref:Sorting nexin n=1 Tax=Neodiprion lecontei TaxID=441921 RepID=A0A6J0BFI2_NEOLC|nr:sorting nexin-6 isoform X1 [Neodiprion lecontei]XP_046434002.1 sorting nexin-6 isoform X1 [Neodiprion fabricii]XP_046490554.1 sorting nexin-6 isoform X1 [Neodiprion pinetum]
MMDGICDSNDILNSAPPKKTIHADTIDLSDKSLQVDISDALSEKDKVKFTVHTKTTLPEFQKPEFLVVRQHEEFVWLHDRFEENEEYAGYIIPPVPPRPDFDASREKLQKLGEGEGTMTREEFTKMKQELEAEYLATFKKTVAMHEMFLTRLAHHPVFRNDHNLRVFLEYDQDLCVRGKNKMEMFGGLVKSFSKTTDEYYLSATVKDVNDFFDQEMTFLQQYHQNLKESTGRADRQTVKHKDVADSYIKISTNLLQLATTDNGKLERFLTKIAETLEKLRKVEGRVASDEDLKLSDTLRYYMRDTAAAKRLLFRRLKALHAYETANRTLEKARAKNKDVHAALEVAEAEQSQTEACEKFEQMSEKGKEELTDFKTRRVAAFKKNLIELTELEIKHAKAHAELLKKCLANLREE